MAATIHPTAIVDGSAVLGEGVVIGPHAIVEADATIGADCEIRAGAVIRRFTSLGARNFVDSCAVLGGLPQDAKFDPRVRTDLVIGSGNTFREGVTVSRATQPGAPTIIGNDCYFMAGSHAGHDSRLGDHVILANMAAVGGHAEIGSRAILSGGVMVHQFCWVGEMVMSQGHAGASQHVPPCVMLANINFAVGLNVVGLRRAPDVSAAESGQVRLAYRLLYRERLPLREALQEMDRHTEWTGMAVKFRDFVRRVAQAQKPHNRGIITERGGRRRAALAE